jgi:hypothetical protein
LKAGDPGFGVLEKPFAAEEVERIVALSLLAVPARQQPVRWAASRCRMATAWISRMLGMDEESR